MAKLQYDVLVIGAGAAGSTAATSIAERGVRVALVERDKIGGTCLNYGCDPTKTLLFVANMLHEARNAARFGVHIADASARWEEVQAYVHHVISEIRGGSPDEAKEELKKQGIDVFIGEAHFLSEHEVEVTGKQGGESETSLVTISANSIVIATGSETLIPPVDGLQEAGFITNVEAISLSALPRRMAILGGGTIGIEFAQMFHRFGVDVIVLEHGSLLDKEDREVADALIALLHKEGLRMVTGAEVIATTRTETGKRVTCQMDEGGKEDVEVDEILVAVGRKPAIEALNLEAAGVKTTKKGITVDETLRTNVPHIWAIGDSSSKYQFTHVASEQAELVADNVLAEQPRAFNDKVVPWVTYTNPPLAHVGKTEEELREAGAVYRVAQMPFKEIERAKSEDQTEGMVKLLVDGERKILGGHILGAHADEVLASIIVAMQAGLTVDVLASTMMPYPTFSEAVKQVAKSL